MLQTTMRQRNATSKATNNKTVKTMLQKHRFIGALKLYSILSIDVRYLDFRFKLRKIL